MRRSLRRHTSAVDPNECFFPFLEGTSSGFGKRLVASVLARGDCVVATARDLTKLRSAFPNVEPRLRLVQLDISDAADLVQQRVKDAISAFGRIDVVVNNAGYGVKAVLEEGG